MPVTTTFLGELQQLVSLHWVLGGRFNRRNDNGLHVARRRSDRHVLALDIAGVSEALAESAQQVPDRVRRLRVKKTDRRHHCLLCARRERRRGRRAAEQRDELAAFHSITSSASASSLSGIWRPSALAVLRLMTSSSLFTCSTGKSAGLTPLRTRPA